MRPTKHPNAPVGEPPKLSPVFSRLRSLAFPRCGGDSIRALSHSVVLCFVSVQRMDAVSAGTLVFVEKTGVRVKHGQPRTLANGLLTTAACVLRHLIRCTGASAPFGARPRALTRPSAGSEAK